MTLVEALVLGIVWGLTVVWPVSAQAHTVVLPWAAGIEPMTPAVQAGTLLGTILATVIAGSRDVLSVGRSLPRVLRALPILRRRPIFAPRRKETADDRRVRAVVLILIAAIPGGLAGVFAEDTIGTWLRGEESIRALAFWAGVALIVGGGVLWYADLSDDEHRRLRHLSWRDALILGFAQATAILPGVSRMAAVLAAARFQGLARDDSARFALWSGVPLYLGALGAALRRVPDGSFTDQFGEAALAAVASLVTGLAALGLLRAVARRGRFTIFVVYRIAVGLMFIILALVAG